MDYCLRKARPGEEHTVFALIADRIDWMNEKGIHQWNETAYLEAYPLEYYKRNLDKLYVLTEKGSEEILCAAVLFRRDERWASRKPSENALYIHNLVSSRNNHGAGTAFFALLEEMARNEGISYLRLDSSGQNEKLASYYEKLGFEPCGTCQSGQYHGILRQKKV